MRKWVKRLMATFLAVVMIFGMTMVFPNSVKAASAVIENALKWAIDIANDNSHLYVYGGSHGSEGQHYDCSSFVSWALVHAGIDVPISTTYNMRKNFEPYGFEWIPWSSIGGTANLKRGDILLNEVEHVEFYLGDNTNVGAHTNKRPAADQISVSGYYNHPWDGVLRYKDEPVYDNPEVDNWFYHGATDHSDFRPVISIKNPETVSSVKFAVRYDTTDWKWYNGEFNGGNAWYCDVLSSDIGVGNYILCHAYVYGKNGSYNGYPFTELTLVKDAEPSVQTWYYDGATDHSDFRPVIRFDNPETVASVKFAVKYDTGDWKWYEGEYNGGNAWYCDILSDDLGSGNHIVCHGYVYAKNGSYKGYPFVELKLDKDYDDPSINKWEYSFNDEEKEINYIIGFDNPETVSNVRFAIRTDQSDWEWFDGKQNEDNTWNYSIKYNNYNIGESIYCHCYVRGRNGFYNGYPYPNIEIKSKRELGDTNLSGDIDIIDVTMIQRHLAVLTELTDEQLILADTNGDGSVDIIDATHLQKYLAGYEGIVLGKT